MPKIVDPDQLNQGTEVVINTGTKTIQLAIAGNLDDNNPGKDSGVTLQALYSFLKEEWLSDTALRRFRFPIKAFTPFEFLMQNGWDWADVQTRDLIRDAGWTEINADEYIGIATLGDFDNVADQAYYQNVSGFSATTATFDKSGEVNEPILTFDADGADTRDFLKVYLREPAKLYGEYDLPVQQGFATLTPTLYRLPLSNSPDLKIANDDTFIDANAPYTGMTIDYLTGSGFTTWASATVYPAGAVVRSSGGRWFRTAAGGTSAGADTDLAGGSDTGVTWAAYAGERDIGGTYYAFNRIVSGNGGTKEQIYEFCQRELRRTTDINDNISGDAFGVVNGNVAVPLCAFLGDTLQTNPGVYVDGFDINDQNSIEFFDITVDSGGLNAESVPASSTSRTFPFTSAGTLNFSSNLVSDASSEYRLYYLNDDSGDNTGRDYDTANALVVNDNSGTPIEGLISSASIAFDYDYDGNVQRGAASAATDAPVVLVAMGLSGAEWVIAQFTITRATGIQVPVNANDERNYSNPV